MFPPWVWVVIAIVVVIIIVVIIVVVTSSSTPISCYTVSTGKTWSGKYYLNSNTTFGGKQTYVMDSDAYYLVWDTSTSKWTFLSAVQMQSAISSGVIAATARTAILNDNDGFPSDSTAIYDWQTSDATGTFSSSC